MTRTTNARLAGFMFLFYIVVGITSLVLFGRATGGAEGTAAALERSRLPFYLWLCDADVAFAPDTLRSMVVRAEAMASV